jgi:hypothetical protein
MAKCYKCDYPYATSNVCPNCGNDNPGGVTSDNLSMPLAGWIFFLWGFPYYYFYGEWLIIFFSLVAIIYFSFIVIYWLFSGGKVMPSLLQIILLCIMFGYGLFFLRKCDLNEKAFINTDFNNKGNLTIKFINCREFIFYSPIDSIEGTYFINFLEDNKVELDWDVRKYGTEIDLKDGLYLKTNIPSEFKMIKNEKQKGIYQLERYGDLYIEKK